MLATHMEVERRYHEIRKTAPRVISGQVSLGSNLNFKLIDENALRASRAWENSKERLVDWKWFDAYGPF